jgi:WD40 repeat protein
MARLLGCLALLASLFIPAATGAPLPEKPLLVITAGNAARVLTLEELPRDVWKVVWGPKPGELALVSWEKPVEVLDGANYRPLRQIGAGKKLIHFDVAVRGSRLAWCENTTQVEVHDLGTGKSVVLETKNSQPQMAFSPNGSLLATGGYGTEAKLWDVCTGKLVRALPAGQPGGLTPRFSPDGKLLVVGNRNDTTRLYETGSGKLVCVLPRQMSQGLHFSPDGRTLAVAYVDGMVGLWDTTTGQMLQLRASGAKEIYTLDWSPKGDVLVTAGREGKITLWDTRELTVVKELQAPEWVIQARFSPDGCRLLTAGGAASSKSDRKVVIWGIRDR